MVLYSIFTIHSIRPSANGKLSSVFDEWTCSNKCVLCMHRWIEQRFPSCWDRGDYFAMTIWYWFVLFLTRIFVRCDVLNSGGFVPSPHLWVSSRTPALCIWVTLSKICLSWLPWRCWMPSLFLNQGTTQAHVRHGWVLLIKTQTRSWSRTWLPPR